MPADSDETPNALQTSADGFTEAFGERLVDVIRQVGGRKSAASIAGVSVDQLDRWRQGASKPPLFGVARLCEAARVDIGWLLTGTGSSAGLAPSTAAGRPGLDAELFGRVVDRVAKVYREANVRLAEIDKGRVAAERYSEITDQAGDADEWPALLDLMEVRLKKTLQTAIKAPGQTKREA